MLKTLTVSTFIFGLSACSMLPDLSWFEFEDEPLENTRETEMQALQQTSMKTQAEVVLNTPQDSEYNEKVDRHLQEWQNMKPDFARLAALESEVKELTKQLNSMQVNQNTSGTQKSITTGSAKQQKPFINSESMYAIQLFSLADKTIMRQTWDRLATKHPTILGNLSPIYQEVRMQGKTFYRVKAGSFSSKSAATKLCSRLKNANTNCFLVKSTGIAML